MNLIIKHRFWGYFGLVTSLFLICLATISPFDFVVPDGLSWRFIREGFRFGSNLKDYWQNILLFVPFGFSISIIIVSRYKIARIILFISLFSSFILSTTIELTQFFLPTRISNLTDIIYNSVGGILGGLIYCFHFDIIRFVGAIAIGKIDQLSYKSIFYAIGIYCSIVTLGILILVFGVNLSNWDKNYYLSIGNEINGNRPWDGYIKSLYISDRGLNSVEAQAALEQINNFFSQDSHSVVSIILDRDRQRYRDSNQLLPNLVWHKKPPSRGTSKPSKNIAKNVCLNSKKSTDNSIAINARQWLKTQVPATRLSERLKSKNEFTIAMTFASNNLNQGGPARIFSLSQNAYTQNIILGQRRKDLYFRLRTPITGRNAVHPEFLIANILDDCLFHNVLFIFKNPKLTFYIDKIENEYSFSFNPYTSFRIFVPWNHHGWLIDISNFSDTKYRLVFYIAITTPLLFLTIILLLKYKSSS